MGFRVYGLGFVGLIGYRVQGFRVQGFRDLDLGIRI